MRIFFVLFLVTSSFSLVLGQSLDSPAGRWKTVDDETGETKSIIEITATGKTFTGKIAEILTDNKDAICTKCTGEQKDQPVLGLTIITDLTAKKDYWANGNIFDPEKGKKYGLSVWYEDQNPNKLFVRGKHWTGLYRTQTWIRE